MRHCLRFRYSPWDRDRTAGMGVAAGFRRRLAYPLLAVLLFSLFATRPPAAMAGSPFYLTVERGFSTTERPAIRLDYTATSEPMLLRILRPRSLERFLEGQLRISRSYEEPLTDLNPGFYFVTGLNKAESPLKVFRSVLSPDFRRSFKDTAFSKAIMTTTPGRLATPPTQVILGPPDGFDLVREYPVDLQFGGTATNDLGWWFEDEAWDEYRYKVRTVSIDPLPDGAYLVQAVQGKSEAQCLVQVSSLSVQVKQSTEQLVVRVVDRDLTPVEGAAVSYRDGRGRWQGLAEKTNSLGEADFTNPEGILDGRLVIRVETPDRRCALVDTDFLPAVSNEESVFVVTDRPIFKPGETFFYKGIAREFENGQLTVPPLPDLQTRVRVIRTDGTETGLQAMVPLTEFGSFSGQFDLDEAETPGLYRLVAEIGERPYGGEFRVRDYVKPTFYLELVERSPTVIPGQRFFVTFRAKRYSGGVPLEVRYEVFLYRKKFETPQWVEEAGGGLTAGSDYYGENRSTSALTEPKRIYSSVEERLASKGTSQATNPWDSAPKMGVSGETRAEFEVPKIDQAEGQEWIYTVMVRAMEPVGSQAVLAENVYMTLSEAQPALAFSKTIAEVGETGLTLAVRSTYPDGKPAPKGGGVVDILLETGPGQASSLAKMAFTTDDRGEGRLALPAPRGRGRLRALATLETLEAKPMRQPAKSQPALMIVGGAEGDTVLDNRDLELYTASTILSPGEKAKVLALLPADWGKTESGPVWETIAGQRIYETRPATFRGRSRWFEVEAKPEYGTGFYQTVTVATAGGKYREQTLGFRIIPWTKRLTIGLSPEREEAEPLKPFRIDLAVRHADGQPAPETELAVTIVDRAVYAVQGEIRPGIFDFFYPLPRLNLGTFYSDELQGYGYADILKRPNFRLGALKSQNKPRKKAMRDTAGWFPHVLTDADGRASITVNMPANVTEWVITAMAADKEGRVGEARGGFRTVADVSVEALGPQFLRQGDEAAIVVKTVNQQTQPVSVRTGIELLGEAALKVDTSQTEFRLEGKGQHLWPLQIEATGAQGSATLRVGLETADPVHVGGIEEFEIPLRPSAMRQGFAAEQRNERLLTLLPLQGTVQEVRVQVSSGLLGVALQSAAVLVSYPYGCTEQLAHTTIPNLVLMDLVRQAGLTPENLGPLAEPLTKAERHAAQGIAKIIRNQKTEGGFGLWPSDPEPSLAATVTALYALKYAAELGVEGAKRAFETGLYWTSTQLKAQFDKSGPGPCDTLTGYLLSRFAEISRWDQPSTQYIAFIERVQADPAAPLGAVIQALKLFAVQARHPNDWAWYGFNERFKDPSVKEALVARLTRALEQFDPTYHLRSVYGDATLFDALGFGYGPPSLISAGMGVLKELVALPPSLETRLKQILLSQVKNGIWISTFETAQVIFNAREILKEEAARAKEQGEKARRLAVRTRDGTLLGEMARIPSGFVGTFSSAASDPQALAKVSDLRLDGLVPNEIAHATILVDVPFAAVTPRLSGLEIERRLLRITANRAEPLDLSGPLHKGDVVVSEVRVRRLPGRDTGTLPSQFVVIEDSIPSLAQALEEDRTYLADARIQPQAETYWREIKDTQRYPDRTVRIARVWGSGEIRVYQVWTAVFSGRASLAPARAFDMYDESLQGNTEALAVRVE